MDSGNLYFIKDDYFDEFQDGTLQTNKEIDSKGNPHDCPCYYAFKENDIVWMIPVSSRLEKYEKIYNKKTQGGKDCETIVFGYVKGNKNAFLIQNMVPVTEDYINNIYIDKATNQPVVLSDKTKKS